MLHPRKKAQASTEYPARNTIINADCLDTLKGMPDACVDMIFADPPYWMRVAGVLQRVEGTAYDGCDDEWDSGFASDLDYEVFTEAWLTECRRVLKKDGSIWVIGGMQCIYTIGATMRKLGFWFINDIIWHKKNPTPNFRGTRLNNSHETLIWATKSPEARYTFNYKTAKALNTDTVTEDEYASGIRKQMGSVWRIPVCRGGARIKDADGNKLHSTQKPEELLYRVINISTKPGELILDPFGGTMTTGVVAKRCGRDFIMIENNPVYCAYGQQRIDSATTQIGDIETAAFDRRPPRGSIKEMIKQGALYENEAFYLKSGESIATLAKDGKLLYRSELLDIHACAAHALGRKAKRLNGFDYWYVKRDGELVSINTIRAHIYQCLP